MLLQDRVPSLFACLLLTAAAAGTGCAAKSTPGSPISPQSSGGGSGGADYAAQPTARNVGTAGGATYAEASPSAPVDTRDAMEPMEMEEYSQSPSLGTQYGEERYSAVRETKFVRQHKRSPEAMFLVRYDDFDGVAAMNGGRYPQESVAILGAGVSEGSLQAWVGDASGSALPGTWIDGELYAIGSEGQRYTIGVENETPYRYEVVISVDGLDVIDGDSASLRKRGYVIDPYSSVHIEGWRTGDDSVAAFRFTGQDDSYAARTGKPRDIGVIGLAFFPERFRQTEVDRRRNANPFPG